jgi:hypothetical protein
VFVGAGLLFANGFVPWWFRSATSAGVVTYNAGLTGPTLIAVLSGAAAALAILGRAMIWPEPAPRKDSIVYVLLGVAAVAALVVGIMTMQGIWLGPYAGIVLAGIMILGGVRRARERRSGWT